MPLTDQASVRREVYRLTDLSDEDAGLIEFDVSSQEAINLMIYDGLCDAQEWLLRGGRADAWLVVGQAVTIAGADTDAAGRYIALESDFLRLYSDEDATCFYVPSQAGRASIRRWGRELQTPREGRMTRGDGYWLEGDRIRICVGARPYSGMVYDYIREPTTPADGTDIDFPKMDRGLVSAFAALYAAQHDYIPGGAEMQSSLIRNLALRKTKAWKRARRSRNPRRIRSPRRAFGSTHWLLRQD